MTNVPAHVFRAYDIRGKAETEMTEDVCRLVGKAFGSELRERYTVEHPTVIVGRDARTHGPALERALIEGLVSAGCCVQRIGQTPTPANYFAVCHFRADGSVQVTASHNPKEDNGLKLQVRNAEACSGEELQMVRKRIEEERFAAGEGTVEQIDAVTPYLKKVSGVRCQVSGVRLKIAVDFGNGVAGPVYGQALRKAGWEIIPLFEEPDGTFPNHIADPADHETLTALRETVRREKADCGVAFDGDGDRVGFVDEHGRVVPADYLLLLLAEDHLQRHPGASVVHTVSMSGILETEIRRLGGNPVMCIVGHSFVEEAMRAHRSHLGGEQSGHFFCGEDYHDYDDALVAAVRILSILSKRNQPLSTLIEHYPKVHQAPEWRPHCDDDKKTEVVRRITEHFRREGRPCLTIDGVRIDFGDGAWAGIRRSNTSPKLSICMEARSPEKLKEVERIVREHLCTYGDIGE